MKSALPKLISNELLLPNKNLLKESSRISSLMYITSKNYCDNKSVYEKHEAGEQPRKVYGELYPEWRKPWIKRDGEFKSKLAVFNENNPSTEIMNALQYLPNLTFQQVKDWWKSMKVIQEIQNQKYLPERVTTLGVNLAAIHFFTYRCASVRLKGEKDWILGGDVQKLQQTLPNTYTEGYYVEAVDCTNFHHNGIRYEGLQNLSGLNFLKWLSLKNQRYIDVWCLDRLAGQNGSSLEYLDISSCKLDTGCVDALTRMPVLKMLVIADPGEDIAVQAALSSLEENKPELIIKVVEPEVNKEISTEAATAN